jgi:hypothetical protein
VTFHLPFRGRRAVQRAEAVLRQRDPLGVALQRRVVRQQRVADELVGEHHRRVLVAMVLQHLGKRGERGAPVAGAFALDAYGVAAARDHDGIRAEPDAEGFLTPQK